MFQKRRQSFLYRMIALSGLMCVAWASRQSPAPGYPWSLESVAKDLLGLLDQVELPGVHLSGETVGGSIAMRLTTLHQDRFAPWPSVRHP